MRKGVRRCKVHGSVAKLLDHVVHLNKNSVSVNGIVQKVFYLPMKNVPEHNLENADINSLLFKILIGPTPNPDLVWEGFVTLLAENGVVNATDKVTACNIPLRR